MPHYFIYRISQGSSALVKHLEKVDRFDAYRDAKQKVKTLRKDQDVSDPATYKIIFAKTELEAEEMLMDKREAPIMEEWEK